MHHHSYITPIPPYSGIKSIVWAQAWSIIISGVMELKVWLLIIRILNILCASMMVGFEIWFTVDLIIEQSKVFVIIIRIFMPIFVVLLAVTILTSEFKYSKVVEHFKFLQYIPGLALFNLFMASLFAFQFSTEDDPTASIVTSVIFFVMAIVFAIMHCLKPAGTESLLTPQE